MTDVLSSIASVLYVMGLAVASLALCIAVVGGLAALVESWALTRQMRDIDAQKKRAGGADGEETSFL